MNYIQVKNAYIHNLEKFSINIPKQQLVVLTGVSGSGKSSLAFDLIYSEGVSRYKQALGERHDSVATKYFERLDGLDPTVAVEQRIIRQSNPRSNVGTRSGINNLLERLFSQEGILSCSQCGSAVRCNSKCIQCGQHSTDMPAAAFSSNSSMGMCLDCYGRGIVPNISEKERFRKLMLSKRGLYDETVRNLKRDFACYAKSAGFDMHIPFSKQTFDVQRAYLYGSDEHYFKGYIPYVHQVYAGKPEDTWEGIIKCSKCQGSGLSQEILEIKIEGMNIAEMKRIPISELLDVLKVRIIDTIQNKEIIKKIIKKASDLIDVGLHYLSLDRKTPTLSGGELQRLFLATIFDVELENLIYIFDEPTVGLHESEKIALIKKIKYLKEQGSSVIVVEHDAGMLRAADCIIEIGPGGGKEGGKLIFQGSYNEFVSNDNSIINKYIADTNNYSATCSFMRRKVEKDTPRLTIHHARTNNLKNVTGEIPIEVMVGVAGVSGSGKSSLISGALISLLDEAFGKTSHLQEQKSVEESAVNNDAWLSGCETINQYIFVSQKPIGRTKTSITASYVGIWDNIRNIFAKQAVLQEREYTPNDFSFNGSGACPKCNGEGYLNISGMMFICDVCEGKRFKKEILKVYYKGLNIHEVLQLTMKDAVLYFAENKSISRVLEVLNRVGMGYINLGQSIRTVSGGEAQRIKLAKELCKAKKKGILYILDEPTTGLSYMETMSLISMLNEIVSKGNSVVVIEHDALFLSYCDWIMELGPGSGNQGGTIIAQGSPDDLIRDSHSIVGKYLIE